MRGYAGKDIVEILKKHGIVVTPHRYKMLEYLGDMESSVGDGMVIDDTDADWFRASRIYASFLEEGYFISLSSVYKNMSLFRNLGLVDPDGRDI